MFTQREGSVAGLLTKASNEDANHGDTAQDVSSIMSPPATKENWNHTIEDCLKINKTSSVSYIIIITI